VTSAYHPGRDGVRGWQAEARAPAPAKYFKFVYYLIFLI